jgi:murein DD-endopeptidase MepM/ murein hydrolase activator NlpD
MVTVPIQTSPMVDPSGGGGQGQGFVAPNVEPIRDFSGQQIAALGKSEENLGNGLVRIANRIQSEVDDATAANKSNLAYEEIAKANNEFSLLSGKEAVDARPAYESRIKQIISNHAGGLENDTQKFIYNNKTSVFAMHSRINIDNHTIKEIKKFDNAEVEATLGSFRIGMVQNADSRNNITQNGEKVGAYATYEAGAIKTFDEWANRNGITKLNENGEVTELYKEKIRKGLYEPVADAITQNLYAKGQYGQAKNFLEQEFEAGHIDEGKYKSLLGTVETGDMHNKAVDTATKLFNKQAFTTGMVYSNPMPSVATAQTTGRFGGDRGTHMHGGVDKAAPLGTPIVSIADGTVTRAYNDTNGGGLSMEVTHQDGSKSIYRHLGEFKAQVGQKVAGGQDVIGAVGMTGRTTGPHLHMEYIDKDGKKIDPETLPIGVAVGGGQPQKVPQTPQEIQDAITSIENPKERQFVQTEYQRLVTQQAAVDKKQDDDAWSKAMEIAWSGDGRNYGQLIAEQPELWNGLTPDKRAILIKGRPEASDPSVIHALNMNPNLAKDGIIQRYRDKMSAHDYDQYFEKYNGPQSEKKLLAAHFDNNMLKVQLEKFDMTKYLHPTKGGEDERVFNQMHLEITTRIDQEQRLAGKELSPEQKEKVIKSVLSDRVTKSNPYWFNSDEFNWRLTKAEQLDAYVEDKGLPKTRLAEIPTAVRDAAQSILRSENLPITEMNVAKFYRSEFPKIDEALRSAGMPVTDTKIMEYYIRNKKRQENK